MTMPLPRGLVLQLFNFKRSEFISLKDILMRDHALARSARSALMYSSKLALKI